MKSPQQVLDELERWFDNHWQLAILNTADYWPHQISLGAPTGAKLESNFPAAQDWAICWQEWADGREIALSFTGRRVFGTPQKLPTHLIVPDLDASIRLLAKTWPARITTAQARTSTIQSHFPGVRPASMLREITDLSEVDFNLLITAGKWFRDNDATGLTARQVPIEGLDSKWLNTARHLVRLLSSNDDLGLVQRPRTTNFTYLDTAHLSSGGRRYDSATQGDSSRPSYTPTTIIITENKDTALYFLDIEGGIAIQGGGAAGPATISKIPWVIECSNVLYWGDLDAEGYEIVHQYRRRGLNVRTILMDQQTLQDYGRFGVTHDSKGRTLLRRPKRLPTLTIDERIAYDALTDLHSHGPFRVEQERIPLEVAHSKTLYELQKYH